MLLMTNQRKRSILIVRCLLLALASVLSFMNNHVIAGVIAVTLASHVLRELKDAQTLVQTNGEQTKRDAEEFEKWRWVITFNVVVATLTLLLFVLAVLSTNEGAKQWAIITLLVSGYWIFDRARIVLWFSCFSCFCMLVSTLYFVFMH